MIGNSPVPTAAMFPAGDLDHKCAMVSGTARYVELLLDVIIHVVSSLVVTLRVDGRKRLHFRDVRTSVVAGI
jgi:hypothetical protein